jgi:hypothetical protein
MEGGIVAMTIAERVSLFVTALMARQHLVFKGEMTATEEKEGYEDAISRLRIELTDQELEDFMNGVALEIHKRQTELSSLGRPIPGNDPQKPN